MTTRRRALQAAVAWVSVASLGASRAGFAQELKPVRMTSALAAATHSIPWIGTEAGVFRRHGLDVTFPRLETTGPESIVGMQKGEWDYASTGSTPVTENVLNGGDAVVILRAHDPHANLFVVTRREIDSLQALDGKKVGVLSDAYSGQTGIKTRLVIEKAGAKATYIGLGTYGNIYGALERGDIAAGALPIHLKLRGERRNGWHAFESEWDVPSVFATSRHVIAADREKALAVVRAYVETIHLWKTDPHVVVPLIQRFLKIDDPAEAEELRAYYVNVFPRIPSPEMEQAMPTLRKALGRYPAAASLKASDIEDASLMDEVRKGGFVDKLYGAR